MIDGFNCEPLASPIIFFSGIILGLIISVLWRKKQQKKVGETKNYILEKR